jgi:integrase/recombinase XerD
MLSDVLKANNLRCRTRSQAQSLLRTPSTMKIRAHPGPPRTILTPSRRIPAMPVFTGIKAVLKAWLGERPGAPGDPLFPTTTGKRLSRDAIERRLARRVALASTSCPSLKAKHVTMHTLRHTAAMRLLLAGNDVTVIALWVGHEQISTTHVYLHADMTHKQQAIDRTKPLAAKPGRYRPPDPLLAFLEAL